AGKFSTLNLTGDSVLTLSGTDTDIRTIDASGMTTGGAVVQNAREATGASTYTGSSGDDTFMMKHSGDVIKAGAGSDTLDVDFVSIIGGISVDLSSTTDQISTFNGAANAGIQTGFINVDLDGYTGNGAEITANAAGSSITGTGSADSISLGAGTDTVVRLAADDGADTIYNFTSGTDTLDLDGIMNGITKAYIEDAAAGFDVGAVNVIVFTDGTITAAATAIAADGNVVATDAIIVVDDDTDSFVYHTDNAAGNGTETLLFTLKGFDDASDLVTGDFVFA
ncbi:hypothetical protein N8386_04430, partial [Planktomarina temperata]|nr:hypothetical protein [Planktomarina temperata]